MKTVFARDFGIFPDTGRDCTAQLASLVCAHGADAQIDFLPGEYRFCAENAHRRRYPVSNSDCTDTRAVSIVLEKCRGLTLNFSGSTLLFSGQTIALALDGCENVTIQNAFIDWDVPFSAEAAIVEARSSQIAVRIDRARYPYHVTDGTLYFDGEGWTSAYFGAIEFDRETKRVRAGDTFPRVMAAEREDGALLLSGAFSPVPRAGNLLVLRHGKRIHPGLYCQESSEIALENVTFYATCGLGALFQFTRDIRIEAVRFAANAARGREVLSGHDDGLHFSNCSGEIGITNCAFHGLMDDAINVHGTSVRIDGIEGNRICGSFCHPQSTSFSRWAKEGDEVAFLKRQTLDTVSSARVRSFVLTSQNTFALELSENVPEGIEPGDALENLTNTPSVVCRKNTFGSGRARGMLVTTPRPVRIEENVFDTSGAAILLCGDANAWYESGACRDVAICDNTFLEDCLTSYYQFYEGVISLCPEIPDRANSQGFHRNIRICGNTFFCAARPLLYAHCAKDVLFARNTIHGKQEKPTIVASYCEIKDEENRTI